MCYVVHDDRFETYYGCCVELRMVYEEGNFRLRIRVSEIIHAEDPTHAIDDAYADTVGYTFPKQAQYCNIAKPMYTAAVSREVVCRVQLAMHAR